MKKSKFNIIAYLFPILTIAFLILIYKTIIGEGGFSKTAPVYIKAFVLFLMIFSFIHLFFGELRTKIIYFEINNTEVIKKAFLGLGKRKKYKISNFDYFVISDVWYRGTYEFLYLMINGKKAIKISEYYHKNYADLKKEIEKNIKYNGKISYNLIDDIKEMFT